MRGLVSGVLNHHHRYYRVLSLRVSYPPPVESLLCLISILHFLPLVFCLTIPSPRDAVPAPSLCRSQPREMIKKLQGSGGFWQGGGGGSGVSGGRGERRESRFRSHVALYLLIHNG